MKCQQAYGEAGITKLFKIMEREIVTGMKLLGAARLEDLKPEMIVRAPHLSRL